ncbi:MAG: gamma-glutamyl-gamma-aminobutyrate hydrolase family protein [Eubacteriales bacterium]|nr:gamma-glutamyl-gamma-aminobutyrate hydrolase family protein [Eubacteriales bacterium]
MPKIGIPLRYTRLPNGRCILYLGEKVRRCVQKAGGFVVPIVQPQDVDYMDTRYDEFEELTDREKESVEQYLDLVDGAFIPGCNKVTPYDKYFLERCTERDLPTLGVCIGMQLMSCAGEEFFKVYEIKSQVEHFQEHDHTLAHKIQIRKDTLLFNILEREEIFVNSYHFYHAVVRNRYIVNAYSEDGIVEGIELPDRTFHLGIQWHPEISYDFDENSRKIIDYFICECRKKE